MKENIKKIPHRHNHELLLRIIMGIPDEELFYHNMGQDSKLMISEEELLLDEKPLGYTNEIF